MEQAITLNGGMNQDISPRYIKEGDYRLALNIARERDSASLGGKISDVGNRVSSSLSEGYKIHGTINTNDSSFVIFSTNNTNGEIGLFTPTTNKYTSLINTEGFNFNTKNPIKGIFRIRNGCERVIYFTDTVNPFRVINLDSLDNYKDDNGD